MRWEKLLWRKIWIGVVFLAGLWGPQVLSAQVDLPPEPLLARQVVVERHSVEAVVEGPLVEVQVTQLLRNRSGQVAEGVYLFPLPADAAVSDVEMTVDGAVLEGRVLDREEARRIYEQIVRAQRDPALLEYWERGVFQTSVFPIPPGEARTVAFVYTYWVEPVDGLFHFHVPLRLRHLGQVEAQEISIRVDLHTASGLRALYTPNFPSSVERSADDAATVTYRTAGELPANDFDLYWGTDDRAVGLSLLSYKPAGEEGYFVLLAAPGLAATEEEIVERDLVVVLDVSGSMRKAKLEQARAAVQSIVESLRPGDRFNLVAFSSGVELWREALQPVDGAGQREAVRWLEGLRAVGATDINRALLAALAQVAGGESARPAYILFVTDGQPTQGESAVDAIVRNALGHLPAERTPRLFTFGVGYDVNTDLLDNLAAELRGGSHYVAPDAAIDEAVGAFYAQVSTPVLAEIELVFAAPFTVTALSPDPLPDLFAGRQLVAVGRYTAGGTGEVALAGEVNGKARLYVYPDRTLVVGGGNPAVARLWAMRQIGQLLSLIRRNGADPELVEEITQLGVRYGIVTPYTSFLVLEPELLQPGGEIPLAELGVLSAQPRWEAQTDPIAAAPAAGEAAVAASQARAALQQAEVAVESAATVRYVAGRSFVLRGSLAEEGSGGAGSIWVDTGFVETMAVTTVALGSDAYFDLLAEPEMAQWLAISAELVVVTGPESAVRVTAR